MVTAKFGPTIIYNNAFSALTVVQPLPELVVVLLLHGGDDLPLVLELVRLLDAGHEEGLHVLSGLEAKDLSGGELVEANRQRPGRAEVGVGEAGLVEQDANGKVPPGKRKVDNTCRDRNYGRSVLLDRRPVELEPHWLLLQLGGHELGEVLADLEDKENAAHQCTLSIEMTRFGSSNFFDI